MKVDKEKVKAFWDAASCGESLLMDGVYTKDQFNHQRKLRYEWEPEIVEFTQFNKYRGKKVLEIGVGLGADHQSWAEAGTDLYGIDLTPRAIANTRMRFELFGLNSKLEVADAETLPFPDNHFDVVYSWGVLLYCPNMFQAINEVHRVLKPGGEAIIMLYHKHSMVGYMLWVRYALMRLKPWTPLKEIYHKFLEAEGTQAFTPEEVRSFFAPFKSVSTDINLCHGDLLTSQAGQRHEGVMLMAARAIWPRSLIKTFFPQHGLFMKIRAFK